jgi:hypothetical protein
MVGVRRALATAAAVLALGVLAGCVGGDADPPPTTVTTEPAPTTTIEQGDAKGIACLNNATAGLAVRNDYNQASRGVAGPPDPEPYRERAAVLRAEHERLGCPGELLAGFLE